MGRTADGAQAAGVGRFAISKLFGGERRGGAHLASAGWGGNASIAGMIVLASLVAVSSSQPALASSELGRPIRHQYRLAEGVTLTTIRYPRAPNEVRVLTLTQGHGAVPDVLPAGAQIPRLRGAFQVGLGGGGARRGQRGLLGSGPPQASFDDRRRDVDDRDTAARAGIRVLCWREPRRHRRAASGHHRAAYRRCIVRRRPLEREPSST